MKFNPRPSTFALLCVILFSFCLMAFSPAPQAGAPAVGLTVPPEVFGVFVVALAAGFAWLISELRLVKQVVSASVAKNLEPNWFWLAQDFSRIAVRAAYQLFDEAEIERRLPWASAYVVDLLEKQGLVISDADTARLRGVIEAAWADFKNELTK